MAGLSLPLDPVFTVVWPGKAAPGLAHAKNFVGVYGLQWGDSIYVGMTVSVNGFKGRWAGHHRSLFTRKRSNSTTRKFREFIKKHGLTAEDIQWHALKVWPNPGSELDKTLTHEIALAEQEVFDSFHAAGFTMLNNVRPRGTGYVRTSNSRRRRRPSRN